MRSRSFSRGMRELFLASSPLQPVAAAPGLSRSLPDIEPAGPPGSRACRVSRLPACAQRDNSHLLSGLIARRAMCRPILPGLRASAQRTPNSYSSDNRWRPNPQPSYAAAPSYQPQYQQQPYQAPLPAATLSAAGLPATTLPAALATGRHSNSPTRRRSPRARLARRKTKRSWSVKATRCTASRAATACRSQSS